LLRGGIRLPLSFKFTEDKNVISASPPDYSYQFIAKSSAVKIFCYHIHNVSLGEYIELIKNM
jgi:hypothetical protein